jgi:signal transduction histidine kinase
MRMQTTIRETNLTSAFAQVLATNEKSETGVTLSNTASTAPAFEGLTHLLHQINNPIQLVYGATGLMDQEIAKVTGRENFFLNQVFQTLKGGIDQLISLVSSLRAQMECLSMINPPLTAVNMNLLVNEILQGEAARFAGGAIRIRRYFAKNLPPIEGNERLLKHALGNMLRNAAEAMPEGGVLSVRTGASERSVFVELADTGCGIPADLDVFQPFATSKARAMGLGLTIARYIVEVVHDGTIAHKGQPDGGTMFCLNFPWPHEPKEASA